MLELGLLYYAAAGQLGAQTHTPTNTWPHALIELQTNELALAAHAHRRQAPVSDVRLTSAARTARNTTRLMKRNVQYRLFNHA